MFSLLVEGPRAMGSLSECLSPCHGVELTGKGEASQREETPYRTHVEINPKVVRATFRV